MVPKRVEWYRHHAVMKIVSNTRPQNDCTAAEALRTWQWYALWFILFLDTAAGLSVICQAAPLAQDLAGAPLAAAVRLESRLWVAFGAGCALGSGVSVWLARARALESMFVFQSIALFLLAHLHR